MLLLIAIALLFASASAQVTCPITTPSANGDYRLRSDGSIILGFRAAVADVVAVEEIFFMENSVAIGTVWAGLGAEVDWGVQIIRADETATADGRLINDYGYIFTSDKDAVLFENTLDPLAIVCEVGSPSSCSSPTSLNCDDRTQGLTQVGSTTALDDLIIPARYDPNDERIAVINILDGTQRIFRDVEIRPYAIVRFDNDGIFRFRKLHIGNDVTIILNTEHADSDAEYELWVDYEFDMDERVRIIRKRGLQNVLVYQHQVANGYVFIGNAPAEREHILPIDIISRVSSSSSGGYVHIGLRQCIKGYIVAVGDVIISNDAAVGHACYNPETVKALTVPREKSFRRFHAH